MAMNHLVSGMGLGQLECPMHGSMLLYGCPYCDRARSMGASVSGLPHWSTVSVTTESTKALTINELAAAMPKFTYPPKLSMDELILLL